MGKGDKRRPTVVDDRTFEERWEKVFGKKKFHGRKSAEREPADDEPKKESD